MKIKTKSFFLIAAAACLLSGCNNGNSSSETSVPESQEKIVNVNTNWEDNGDYVYDMSVSGDGLEITYDKAGAEWAYVKKSLGAVQEDLEGVKKLRMDMKLVDHSAFGPSTVIMKIEFNAPEPAHEAKFKISETMTSYEWDVSDYPMSTALQMLLFVEPTCGTSVGKVVFDKLQFSDAEIRSEAVEVGTPVTYTSNVYASGDTFDVNHYWHDIGDFAYDISEANGVTTVKYIKYGNGYSFARTYVENIDTFRYLNLNVAGDQGKEILFKVEGAEGQGSFEEKVVFGAGDTAVTLDLSKLAVRTGKFGILLVAEPGVTTTGTGTILIKKAEVSNTPDVVIDVEVPNKFADLNPWDAYWEVSNFYDGGDKVFVKEGAKKFSWNHAADCWSFIKADIQNAKVFDKIEVSLTMSAPTKIIVKEDNAGIEQTLTFTADALTQVATLNIPSDKMTANKKLIFFPLYDSANATVATLDINYARLYVHGVGVGENAIKYLVGQADYTIDRQSGGTMLEWVEKGEWSMVGFRLDPTADFSGATKIEIKFAGTVTDVNYAKNVKIKVNDAQEYNIDTIEATSTVTITTAFDAAAKPFVGMFFNYGTKTPGYAAITSIKVLAAE